MMYDGCVSMMYDGCVLRVEYPLEVIIWIIVVRFQRIIYHFEICDKMNLK